MLALFLIAHPLGSGSKFFYYAKSHHRAVLGFRSQQHIRCGARIPIRTPSVMQNTLAARREEISQLHAHSLEKADRTGFLTIWIPQLSDRGRD